MSFQTLLSDIPTEILLAFLIFLMCATCPTHLTVFGFTIIIIFGDWYVCVMYAT